MLTDASELACIDDAWRSLIDRGRLPSVFQHPAWVRAWWRFYGTGRRLLVMACHEEESLVGLVPLMLNVRTCNFHFIGHPLNDRNGAVVAAGRLHEVWAAAVVLLRRSSDWSSAVLPELLDEDVRACEAGANGGAMRTPALPSPLIDLPPTWHDYAGLSNRRRAGWRRDLRALGALGEVRFACCSGAELSEDDLAAFHHDRIRRWRYADKLHELSAVERSNDFPEFLTALARSLGPQGMFHLGRLMVGDRCVSQNLYLGWDDVVLDYMRAFDPAVRAHSPGNLATLHAIRHFIGEARRTYDFGRGDEPYKFALGARPRDFAGVVVSLA